ncbi:MAG: hypothetical protein ACOC3X_00640 [Nanoarchaeota archaeon]
MFEQINIQAITISLLIFIIGVIVGRITMAFQIAFMKKRIKEIKNKKSRKP